MIAVSPPIPLPSETRTSTIDGIAFFSAEQGLLVGGSQGEGGPGPAGAGLVWRTENGGAHWTREAVSPGPLRSVAVVGNSLAWASSVCESGAGSACRTQLLASRDGGRSWQTIAPLGFVALDFVDAAHGWCVRDDRPATLEVTSDGGRTWSPPPTQPCPTVAPLAADGVSFVDRQHGWVACTGLGEAGESDKAVVATDDGSRTWHVLASAYPVLGYPAPSTGSIPDSNALWGIAMRANGTGVIWMPLGGADGTWRTADGGRTWTDIQMGAHPGDFGALAGCLVDNRTWFLVLDTTGLDQVVRSTDAGRTWQPVETPS